MLENKKNSCARHFFYKIRLRFYENLLQDQQIFSAEMTAASDIDIKDEPLLPSADDNEVGYTRFIFILFTITDSYVFPFAIVLKYA